MISLPHSTTLTHLSSPQASRATSLIVAAVRYYRTWRDGHLVPGFFSFLSISLCLPVFTFVWAVCMPVLPSLLLFSILLQLCRHDINYQRPNTLASIHILACIHIYIYMHAHTFFPQEIYHTSSKSKTSSYERLVQFVPRRLATVTSMLFGAYPLDMSQYHRLFLSTRCVNVDACK